jgi:receptor protein-tyrosine kinase
MSVTSVSEPKPEVGHALHGEAVRRYALSPELLTLHPEMPVEREAIYALSDRVISQEIGLGRRGLAVCGPSVGVGVSFIAANLAVALAQNGVSTLLIDANMRDPGIQRLFAPTSDGPGLEQHLRGDGESYEAVLHPEVLPRLSIIYAGAAATDSTELLAKDAFRGLVEACMRDFTYTIIDTPAANRSSDALRVGRVVGHALIVARKDVSYIEDIETLAGELTQGGVEVMGALFNGA